MNSECVRSRHLPFDIVEVDEKGARNAAHVQILEAVADSASPEPGFYLVIWLDAKGKRGKGGRFRSFGPFPSAKPARALLTTALQWGLVDVEPAPQIVARRVATPSHAPACAYTPKPAAQSAAVAHSMSL